MFMVEWLESVFDKEIEIHRDRFVCIDVIGLRGDRSVWHHWTVPEYNKTGRSKLSVQRP